MMNMMNDELEGCHSERERGISLWKRISHETPGHQGLLQWQTRQFSASAYWVLPDRV